MTARVGTLRKSEKVVISKTELKKFRRVLICGDREWEDYLVIRNFVRLLHKDVVIIHGACRGADLMAEQAAKELQLDYMGFPARWNFHGKPAGPIRNYQMLKKGKPDLVVAFHENLKKSYGTKDMVQKARKAGIPVEVISE